MRSFPLAAIVLASLTATASAHGLVSVGVTEDAEADLVAVSLWGDAEGRIAITVFGDADGENFTWSVCGSDPCAGATFVGPSSEGLFYLAIGTPHDPNGIVVSDRDADADTLAVSLFGRADCSAECSTTHNEEPTSTVAVSGTGCADGAVTVSGTDCADGAVTVSPGGLDNMDGDEFVVGFATSFLP